jgi:hypothetical protein
VTHGPHPGYLFNRMTRSSLAPSAFRPCMAALALVTAACNASTALENPDPDFDGVILALLPPSGAWELNLRIERSSGDTAIVWIARDTRVYLAPDGKLQSTEPDRLARGMSVDVWTTGVEYRSLPPQYRGTKLVAY